MDDDVKIILEFVLEYGGEGSLPNMDEGGSGDIAYEAALRLRHRQTLIALRKEL